MLSEDTFLKCSTREAYNKKSKSLFIFSLKTICVISLLFFNAFISIPRAHAGLFSDLIGYLVGRASADDTPVQLTPETTLLPLLGSKPLYTPNNADFSIEDDTTIITTTQDTALVASHNPLGTLSTKDDQITVYTVGPGDTLSSIAANFGVSVNTILWANNIRDAKSIKDGDELVILPVTGIQYKVKKGDTLDSIARQFKPKDEEVTPQDFVNEILSFNGLVVGEPLEVASTVIIPEGEFAPVSTPSKLGTKPGSSTSRFAKYPEYSGYYLRPIIGGRRSRGIHGYNGVDLASSCGLPVLASAQGSIIVARTSGWNGGYGKYVVIRHPNGTQTLYAHMSALFVVPGQVVSQGLQIGNIGSTGNSTGCHVHFEIRGAKNPF